MSRRIWAIALVLLVPGAASAQTLAEKVPAYAVFYASWSGSESLGDSYKGSRLDAVLRDSQVGDLVHRFIPQLMELASRRQSGLEDASRLVRTIGGPLWKHPSAIYLTGVDFKQPGNPIPYMAVLCQAGNDAPAMEQELNGLIQKLGPVPYPVFVLRQGDLVALTVGYKKPQAALAGNESGPLADDAGFKFAMAHVSPSPVVTAYANIERLSTLISEGIKAASGASRDGSPEADQMRRALAALDLKGLKRAVWTGGFGGRDWVEDGFIAAPAPRSGMAAMLESAPIPDDFLAVIPATATTASAFRFNMSGLFAWIRSLTGELDPNSGRQFDDALAQFSQQLGADIEKDLIGSFGQEWATYSDPEVAGRGILGTVVVNRMKDPATGEASLLKVQSFLSKLAQQQQQGPSAVKLGFCDVKSGDVTIHYAGLPLVSPAWAVHDGYLYFGLYPQVVAAAAEQVAGKGKSILDNPDFTALRKRLKAGASGDMQFADLPKTVVDAYPTWMLVFRITGLADMYGVQSPPMLLPPLQKLKAQLAPAAAFTWSDADGIHARSASPFPGSQMIATDFSSMMAYAAPVEMSILLPALSRAREQAFRVKSASNLRQMGQAAMMAANADKKGRYPKTLGDLMEQDLSAEVFINPRIGSKSAPPNLTAKQQAAWVNENSDYVWTGNGKDSTSTPNDVLAYEKPEGLTEGINILFGDGHVEFLKMPDALERIAAAERPAAEPKVPAP